MSELSDHLTEIESAKLKPVNLLQAAEADLLLFERKQERKADPDRRYTFLGRHVRRAREPAHLLALAYFERYATDKPSTHRIYQDIDLLRRVLIALLQGADEDELRRMENT